MGSLKEASLITASDDFLILYHFTTPITTFRNRFGVRAPAHLFGSLARHDYGRTVLEDERVVRQLLIQMGEDKDMALVKGAVVALGQIGGSPEGTTRFKS